MAEPTAGQQADHDAAAGLVMHVFREWRVDVRSERYTDGQLVPDDVLPPADGEGRAVVPGGTLLTYRLAVSELVSAGVPDGADITLEHGELVAREWVSPEEFRDASGLTFRRGILDEPKAAPA